MKPIPENYDPNRPEACPSCGRPLEPVIIHGLEVEHASYLNLLDHKEFDARYIRRQDALACFNCDVRK